jgi:hypothetical protein
MGLSITLNDTDGTAHTYTAKPFKEFTVNDWQRLCLPKNELEGIAALHEELKRWTGIPLKHLRRLPAPEVDKLVDALVEMRREAKASQDTPEPLPTVIDHAGKRWVMPTDLEQGTTYGQWVDMDLALDGAETEPEIMAAVCACLLVPEGEEYQGYHKTLDIMGTLPASTAMSILAFFLSKSDRLRNAIAHCMTRRVMSLLPEQGPEPTSTTSDTGTGTD